jgi:dephospho-CoA kinase
MIIGLSGYAQTGKDTVADYLVKSYGFVRVAFADPIREALYKLDPKIRFGESSGVSLSHAVDRVGWEEVKKISTDARELLQRLGTEVGRDMFGNDFWVNQAILRAKEHKKVVISDVRYVNEAEAVRLQGGLLFRINKNNVVEVNKHESEKNLNDYKFDHVINNNSTKEDLYKTIDNFFVKRIWEK